MNSSQLNEEELNLFRNIHQQILPHREKRYKTFSIIEKDDIDIDLKPIINKSIEILNKFNYLNYNIMNKPKWTALFQNILNLKLNQGIFHSDV